MKTKVLVISLFLVTLLFIPALSTATGDPIFIPFETVAQGEMSSYHYGDPGFAGMDMVIRDRLTWEKFWKEHTAGITPPPPVPEINFWKEMVIVTLLGYQTTGGGPSITVLDVSIDNHLRRLHMLIEDNETPGPLDVITNPFHIIKLRRIHTPSIAFEHQRP